jgi:hypothetical protein
MRIFEEAMNEQIDKALSEQLDEVVKIIKDMDFESIADKKEVWIDKYKLISEIEKLKEKSNEKRR